MAGALGEIFEAESCVIEGYQCVSLSTAGTGIIARGCTFYDFVANAVATIVGNTTGQMRLMGCVFVDSATSTGYPYNSTTAIGLGRQFTRSVYTQLPQQAADQGIDGQALIVAATEFAGGDPRTAPLLAGSLVERGVWAGTHDYNRRLRHSPASLGAIESASEARRLAASRPAASR